MRRKASLILIVCVAACATSQPKRPLPRDPVIETILETIGSSATFCDSARMVRELEVPHDVCLERSVIADDECPRRVSAELPEMLDEADQEFVISAISACQLGFVSGVPYDPAVHRAKVRAKH